MSAHLPERMQFLDEPLSHRLGIDKQHMGILVVVNRIVASSEALAHSAPMPAFLNSEPEPKRSEYVLRPIAIRQAATEQAAGFAVLSARVGSSADNRLGGWHSYRASKAALNMLVRNFAIELAVRNSQVIVGSIHPGTVETALSKPFQRSVPQGELFQPEQSAAHILSVMDQLSAADSGGLFAWNGERIP
jgi:NAD(P)-dependent dehydrogenase (short-subunit alcohol dehydrogenase family)